MTGISASFAPKTSSAAPDLRRLAESHYVLLSGGSSLNVNPSAGASSVSFTNVQSTYYVRAVPTYAAGITGGAADALLIPPNGSLSVDLANLPGTNAGDVDPITGFLMDIVDVASVGLGTSGTAAGLTQHAGPSNATVVVTYSHAG